MSLFEGTRVVVGGFEGKPQGNSPFWGGPTCKMGTHPDVFLLRGSAKKEGRYARSQVGIKPKQLLKGQLLGGSWQDWFCTRLLGLLRRLFVC